MRSLAFLVLIAWPGLLTAQALPLSSAPEAPSPTSHADSLADSPADSHADSPANNTPADPTTTGVSPAPAQRLPPLRFHADHADLRLGGLAQLTSEVETRDGETDGFVDFRRLRVDVRGLFLDDRVMLRGHVSAMPRGAELLDLYAEGALADHARLRVGVAKTPFTAYRQQSINDHVLVDWPIVSRWMGGERQLGLTLEGTPGIASYALGVYGGDASRPQNQRFSTAYGEKAPTRSGFRDATGYDVPHPELMARGGVQLGPIHASANVAWDVRPTHAVDAAARFALEMHLGTERVGVWAIGYLALHEELDGAVRAGLGGLLFDVSHRVHPRVELAARWSTVLFSDALRTDARATADARIAASAGDDQARLTSRYADVGHIEALHEATAGFAIYAFGHSLKWQTDASLLRERRVDGAEHAFRLRLQAQLAF